jgi:Fe-S oxidoreductase
MEDLCCGRPLYDYGMLGQAKKRLARILLALRQEIVAGTPIVVLEPSCCAVFRDELLNLYPNNADAKRLSERAFTLAEFLRRYAPHHSFPRLNRRALLHGHCHQKALMGMAAEEEVLRAVGIEFRSPDSGCCGMAGSFGFEKGDRYEVSVKCGERALLPEVRQAGDQDLIISDGFSCKTQIEQGTDRSALHLAQVLQLALRRSYREGRRPEEMFERERAAEFRRGRTRAGTIVAAVGLISLVTLAAVARDKKRR